jgi:hypothetical protein
MKTLDEDSKKKSFLRPNYEEKTSDKDNSKTQTEFHVIRISNLIDSDKYEILSFLSVYLNEYKQFLHISNCNTYVYIGFYTATKALEFLNRIHRMPFKNSILESKLIKSD